MSSAGWGQIKATPDALNDVFPLELDTAQSERDRCDHVRSRLLRTTGSSAKYLANLLNANRAPGVSSYTRAEVERHLAQLRADGHAVYEKFFGWRLR